MFFTDALDENEYYNILEKYNNASSNCNPYMNTKKKDAKIIADLNGSEYGDSTFEDAIDDEYEEDDINNSYRPNSYKPWSKTDVKSDKEVKVVNDMDCHIKSEFIENLVGKVSTSTSNTIPNASHTNKKITTDCLTSTTINDSKVYATNFVSACCCISDVLRFKFPGGFVFPVTTKYFKSFELPTGEQNELHVADFESLYPTMMVLNNICQTTSAYDPRYMIDIGDGRLISPFDDEYIQTMCIPIRINKVCINAIYFCIRRHVRQSVTSVFLNKMNTLRKAKKKSMNMAKTRGDDAAYNRDNNTQKNLKLMVNAIYGKLGSFRETAYRPIAASAVSYSGRLYLTKLVMYATKYFVRNNLSLYDRGVLYGDTDSIFIKCSRNELTELLGEFQRLNEHVGVVVVELERTLSCAFFLAKKKYILKEIYPEDVIYSKGVFTTNMCPPARNFLERFGATLVKFFEGCISKSDFSVTMNSFFTNYNNASEESFNNRFRLSKDFSLYKKPSMIHKQLLHARKIFPNKEIGTENSVISFSHYNFIFKSGPSYGIIDTDDRIALLCNNTFDYTNCRLVDELVPIYESYFKSCDIKPARDVVFIKNLKTSIGKITECLDSESKKFMIEVFVECQRNTFNASDQIFKEAETLMCSDEREEKMANIINKRLYKFRLRVNGTNRKKSFFNIISENSGSNSGEPDHQFIEIDASKKIPKRRKLCAAHCDTNQPKISKYFG